MAKKYDLSDLSFLIIDDNNYMISIVKTLLRGFGVHEIHEAHDAAEAFEEFRNVPVDIILLDYAMDTLDGIEFARMVRTADDTPNPYIPIVMLSAYSERYRVTDARDVGITEFLRKPICAQDLHQRIIQVIENPRPFIRTPRYFGPDRRRIDDKKFKGENRRVNELKVEKAVKTENMQRMLKKSQPIEKEDIL
ncbi:MAG: two-component system response regulator [Hyphomicrobiales bacterium]|nr:MAG: two-component system response regulator [Hyphomicrobiales bacterium]